MKFSHLVNMEIGHVTICKIDFKYGFYVYQLTKSQVSLGV